MIGKHRFGFLAEVRDAFEEYRVERAGGVVASLVSAEPLGAEEIEGIGALLKKRFGRHVFLRASTDARLVAGVKVTVGGVTYDGTLRTQLQRLREKLVFGVKKDQ